MFQCLTTILCVQAPAVDGVELSQPLIHQSVQHPNKDVSVLGGANLDEGTEFMGATPVRSNVPRSRIFVLKVADTLRLRVSMCLLVRSNTAAEMLSLGIRL